jgi:hypothetical protein
MQGHSLRGVVETDAPVRKHALFGAFGGHVSVTDGRYVYMRACADESNTPLFEHTLMPTHMRGFFSADELAAATLEGPFEFTKGMPVLRTPGQVFTNPYAFGTLLFDLAQDPRQQHPLVDDDLERRLAQALVIAMREAQAPASQFERLGLPVEGDVGPEHLLCARQQAQVATSRTPAPPEDSFPRSSLSVHSRVADLLADPGAAAVLARHCRPVMVGPFGEVCGEISLYRAAAAMIGVLPWDRLRLIADDLAQLDAS